MRKWRRQICMEGLNLEKLVAQSAAASLILHGVRRTGARSMNAAVTEDDLPRLQEIAQRGGWRIRAGRRYGLGAAAEWVRRRWLLAACLCVGICLWWLASQVMWAVEVTGAGPYGADLTAWLDDAGICPPMLRAKVDAAALQAQLERRYPRVAWVECGWRGMSLEIRLVEGVVPREKNVAAAMDVIASRDGVVDMILTSVGTAAVSPGDIVCKGQVLIRGEERTGDGMTRPAAASGTVLARVWEGAAITMNAYVLDTAYSGRTDLACTASCPWFDLWHIPPSGYENEDTSVTILPLGGIFLPLTFRREVRHEAEYCRVPADMDALCAQAREAALLKLYEKTGPAVSLVDKWVNCSMIDDEKLQAVAVGELLTDIGVQVPSSGMAAAE